MADSLAQNPRAPSLTVSAPSYSGRRSTARGIGHGSRRSPSSSENHHGSIPPNSKPSLSRQFPKISLFGHKNLGHHTPFPIANNRSNLKYTFADLVIDLIGRDKRRVSDNSQQRIGPIPHVQSQGSKVWQQFENHATILGESLQHFQDAVHELGSSFDLALSAKNIHNCLSLTQWVIRENAARLFPRGVESSQPPKVEDESVSEPRRQRSWPPPSVSESKTDSYVERRRIHTTFYELAESIGKFRDALVHFPEFDHFGSLTLLHFESDLKYWSSCLEQYEGRSETLEVQTYIHDLSRELGEQFNTVSHCLKDYIACVPSVRLSQKHATSNLQNLATVATFFSAVTATTIQYSFMSNGGKIAEAVNVLWFTSLVFSIASALNSFLILTWRRATYSSPQSRIPRWLWLWIRQCAPIFLLVSVVTFLAGLACFAFSSQQSTLTRIMVILCEGISSFGLLALLVLLAADKWSFYQLQRQHGDHLFGLPQIFKEKPGSVLPTHIENTASWSAGHISRFANMLSPAIRRFVTWVSDPAPPLSSIKVALDHISSQDTSSRAPPGTSISRSSSRSLSPAQQRWRRAIRSVILVLKALQREREREFLESKKITDRQQSLKQLSIREDLEGHEAGASTSGMQFNPDGTQLAVCGKRLSIRCELGTSVAHPHPYYMGQARQIIWSASGEHLLTRTNRAIHVHNLTGDMDHQKLIRYETSSYILSIPNTKADTTRPKFISVEGRNMNKLALIDMSGEEQWTHPFEDHISIQHADVAPDGSWILLAAMTPQTPEGFKPKRASMTRKLIVFNLINRQIEHQVPLWNDVQHVTISQNGKLALVTYNKYPPPQLWRLHDTPSGIRLCLERQFCARDRVSAVEFDAQRPIEFSGRAWFLDEDRFVCCVTNDGKVHFWRRDKSDPVYVLATADGDQEKPVQIECSQRDKHCLFATRSQNGRIRVWGIPAPAPELQQANPGLTVDTSNLGPGTSSISRVLTDSPLTAQDVNTDSTFHAL